LVVWNGKPLSFHAVPEVVLINGRVVKPE